MNARKIRFRSTLSNRTESTHGCSNLRTIQWDETFSGLRNAVLQITESGYYFRSKSRTILPELPKYSVAPNLAGRFATNLGWVVAAIWAILLCSFATVTPTRDAAPAPLAVVGFSALAITAHLTYQQSLEES